MRMHRVMLTAGLLGMLGTACGGGAYRSPRLLEPEVELTQVIVRGVGLLGGALDLVVNVENPNDVDLRLVGVDGGLETPQGPVGSIRSREVEDIPAGGTATLVLPMRFEWKDVGNAFRTALGYGDLAYRFRGQVRLASGDRLLTYPFTREGRVPLKSLTLPVGSRR
jgi:hypothetical protein